MTTFLKPDHFFTDECIKLLKTLKKDQTPEWGMMTPQHMVEHLVSTWIISNGRFQVPAKTTPEQQTKKLKFLSSELPFERGITNPVTGQKLNPLRKNSLTEAIQSLERAMQTFFEFHKKNPTARPTHPVFGPLNKEEWLRFQAKHMSHHLAQFNLL